MFAATRDGTAVPLEEVIPEWGADDRLGIVIREPFGSLGASLLLQVAGLLHYEVEPGRRCERPQYPQLYAFHVCSMFGDHSSFDIFPPRREVLVGEDPAELLGAINDRAITRLLVPDIPPHDLGYIAASMSGWTDEAAFRENVMSAWAYSAAGTVDAADLTVSANAEELERMATCALTPEETYEHFRGHTGEQLVTEMEIGPSTPSDLLQWRECLRARIEETPRSRRRELLRERARAGTARTQGFRSLSGSEALARL